MWFLRCSGSVFHTKAVMTSEDLPHTGVKLSWSGPCFLSWYGKDMRDDWSKVLS